MGSPTCCSLLSRLLTLPPTLVPQDNRGVGGTFAQTWALTPNALRDAVTANPDASHVWLSLGGNDGIARLAIGQRPIEDIVEVTIGFMKMSLDPLFEMHPHIQVLLFGYEIIQLDGLLGGILGLALLPECAGVAACMNGGPGMDPLGTYALQQASDQLAQAYPNNIVSIDLRGSMQEASGTVPGPFPNLDRFTPGTMMGDPIHPNYAGYSALLQRSFIQYWSQYFPASTPVRNATAAPIATPDDSSVGTRLQPGQLPVEPLDEPEYRRQAASLGISPEKIEEVISWHRNTTASLLMV